MNKNILIGIGAVVVLGGALFFIQSEEKLTPSELDAIEIKQESKVLTNSMSMKDLLLNQQNVSCTFSGNLENSKIEGTVYVGDGKMRGDYVMTANTVTNGMETHMIIDGTSMYYWTGISTQGFKSAFSATGTTPTTQTDTKTIDYNQAMDYACNSWVVDNTKFIPPTTISFTDLQNPTSAKPGNTLTGPKSQQCGACELIPDPNGKAQCKVALQCN